eukprot:CAMPEP_0206498048 /NCGR_PEP_ID=MMETSP0324_2-20121206/50678_1 /ASSEMBLY_ACC=CAM_ASM_000836 /TAXON_ID=2866 /ORGANISM="Crypthecodinium cohnii, Strain Seligo" /LENGTH=148 /DNA_ID=CAMNT_0053983993 /DNA_START=329 /DNA_END=775 /DNA_ORIENTATION=+
MQHLRTLSLPFVFSKPLKNVGSPCEHLPPEERSPCHLALRMPSSSAREHVRDFTLPIHSKMVVGEDKSAIWEEPVEDDENLVWSSSHLVGYARSLAKLVAELRDEVCEEVGGQQRVVERLTDEGVDDLFDLLPNDEFGVLEEGGGLQS